MHEQKISVFNSFLTSNKNIIWAGALTLAWKELKQKFVKEDIRLNTQDKDKLKIIQNFNSAQFSEKDISQKSIYIKSGYGMETLKCINKEVKEKFPQKSFKDLWYKLSETDIISYAYLLKKIAFQCKFSRRKQVCFKFNNTEVASFYAEDKEQKKQIQFGNYQDKDSFLIRLLGKDKKDYIYFIKEKQYCEMEDIINRVIKAEDVNKFEIMGNNDQFQMPVVEVDCQRRLQQILNIPFLNETMKGYFLSEVIESIMLNIDEEGAKVENEAVVIASRRMMISMEQPKEFILNTNFWVVMKEPKKHPYICVYIVNPIDKK